MGKVGRPVKKEKVDRIIQYFNDGENGGKAYTDSTIAQKVGTTYSTVKKLKDEWLAKKIEESDEENKDGIILGRKVTIEEESSELAIRILNKELKRIRIKQGRDEELSTREIEVLEKVQKGVFDRIMKMKTEAKEDIGYNIIKMEICGNEEILQKLNIKPT